jgi:hypothetical protein
MIGQALAEYLCSVPERVLRSAAAIAGGALREIGEVAVPRSLRRTHSYRVLVEVGLRFMIEQVGQVEGVYAGEDDTMKNFVIRRTAGHVLEVAGIVAFSASPVWVLAVLADLSGAGRDLIADISDALKEEGLLAADEHFESVEQLLDGFEGMAGRLADTANTPPLDVAGLREEWRKLKAESHKLPTANLPSAAILRDRWQQVKIEAQREERSVFQMSTAMAISAVRRLPDDARWLSRAVKVSARRAGHTLAAGLLDDYRVTLAEIHETGFLNYWSREFQPYLAGALRAFDPQHETLTQRLLHRR